jgi:lysine-N-methylase
MHHDESEPPAGEHHILELTEPSYMEKFTCWGGSCPDTCCQRWDIVLDAATCERYAHSRDTGFRHDTAKAIEHRQEAGQELAVIRLGRGQRCPFLRNDGWCLIQRRTSEFYLSEVCRTYPRVIHIWKDTEAERALCLSCIAAAHLILGRDEPICLRKRELDEAEWAGLRIAGRGQQPLPWSPFLRQQLVEVLQHRLLPLRQRLFLADQLFWQAGHLSGHHAAKHFAELAATWHAKWEDGRPQLPEAPSAAGQLEQLQCLVLHRLESQQLRPEFQQRLKALAVSWHFAAGQRPSLAMARQYSEGRELYAMEVRPSYGMFWENFLVNGVFKDLFLLADEAAFYAGWFRLLVQMAFLRLLLLTKALDSGSLPPRDEAVWLAHLVGQEVGHDALYLEQMRRHLAAGGDESAAVQVFCRQMI